MTQTKSHLPQPDISIADTASDGLPALIKLDQLNAQRSNSAAFYEWKQGVFWLEKTANASDNVSFLELRPGPGEISYGIYSLQGEETTVAGIDVNGVNPDGGKFWAAIANYRTSRWQFVESDPGEIDLEGAVNDVNGDDFLSPDGFIYIAVIAYDEDDHDVELVSYYWDGQLKAPDEVRATLGQEQDRIEINWNYNEFNADFFCVERAEAEPGPYVELGQVTSDTFEFIDLHNMDTNDLPVNKLFYYRVFASNGEETSPPSNVVSGYRGTVPGIFGLTATKLTDTSVLLRWIPNEDLDGYRIYRQNVENLIGTVADGSIGEYEDTTATADIAYEYFVEPYIGAESGPIFGPVTGARATWDGPLLADNEGFDKLGRGIDLAIVNGKPSYAFLAETSTNPATDLKLVYITADDQFPVNSADFTVSIPWENALGTISSEIELFEFDGKPLIFFTDGNEELLIAYGKVAVPTQSSDWLIQAAANPGIKATQLSGYSLGGIPVVAYVHDVLFDASLDYVSVVSASETNVVIDVQENVADEGNKSSVCELDGKLAIVHYGQDVGFNDQIYLSTPSKDDPTDPGSWNASLVATLGFAAADISTANHEGKLSIVWTEGTVNGFYYIRAKTESPTGPSDWFTSRYRDPLIKILNDVELVFCGDGPLVLYADAGKLGYEYSWYPVPGSLEWIGETIDSTGAISYDEISMDVLLGYPLFGLSYSDGTTAFNSAAMSQLQSKSVP